MRYLLILSLFLLGGCSEATGPSVEPEMKKVKAPVVEATPNLLLPPLPPRECSIVCPGPIPGTVAF